MKLYTITFRIIILKKTMKKLLLFLIIGLLLCFNSFSKTSSEIYEDLKKLNSFKRVMYMAAHPDDENTKVISWLSKGENAEVYYLSLTRGSGGQNLIGDELGKPLGVIRTQELLEARKIDGGKQYFSSALDFGYSKSAEETFEKWNKEKILKEVVDIIRKIKPHVIITRFPTDSRAGHGHHTASAILAIEAAKLADDKTYKKSTKPTWKVKSIYWNASSWWDKTLPEKSKNNINYLYFDIGSYNKVLGKSYNEIGSYARSMHRCQGFGVMTDFSSRIEYFKHLYGEKLKNNFFENIDENWSELTKTSNDIDFRLKNIIENYDFKNPQKHVPELLEIYSTLVAYNKRDHSLDKKIAALKDIIFSVLGIKISLRANDYYYTPNNTTTIKLNLVNRSNYPIEIKSLKNTRLNKTKHINKKTTNFKENIIEANITIDSVFSNPIWLEGKNTNSFEIAMTINDTKITITKPLEFYWVEPSYGQKKRIIKTVPEVSIGIKEKNILVKENETKKIQVSVTSYKNNLTKTINILPSASGWKIKPSKITINNLDKYEKKWYDIEISRDKDVIKSSSVLFKDANKTLFNVNEIEYDHIGYFQITDTAKIKLTPLKVKIVLKKIAYIKGVDEKVPEAIKQLGFNDINIFSPKEFFKHENINSFDVIVLGIRVFNVSELMRNNKKVLFNYIKNGGNLVVQYNTVSWRKGPIEIAPTKLVLSRKRVTEEDAKATLLNKNHKIFNSPNKITDLDFKNWVQERGLYFASEWDNSFTPLIKWNDKNSEPLEGGLLVGKYGKGNYIYCGISFFRQLPKGIVGAYRLFANILSYE